MLEQTAKDVEAMMVQITADKQEADVTQKHVAKQEQEADEQAAKVRAAMAASAWQLCHSTTREGQCNPLDIGMCSLGSK